MASADCRDLDKSPMGLASAKPLREEAVRINPLAEPPPDPELRAKISASSLGLESFRNAIRHLLRTDYEESVVVIDGCFEYDEIGPRRTRGNDQWALLTRRQVPWIADDSGSHPTRQVPSFEGITEIETIVAAS